jgi:putative transposase
VYSERLLPRVAEKLNMYVVAVEVREDHVHLCLEIPPQLSVGAAVRTHKGLGTRHLAKRFPHLNKCFWGGPMWSPSYFARTVGEGVTAEKVRKYIEAHDERTELGPVQAELLRKGKAKRRTKGPQGSVLGRVTGAGHLFQEKLSAQAGRFRS